MAKQQCIRFSRNKPSYFNVACVKQAQREQINEQTAYLDLSNIYGSSLSESNSLRSFVNGQLLSSPGLTPNRVYLPKSEQQCSQDSNVTLKCFRNGDPHVNSNLHLVAINTLFLRNHNRMAASLALINPRWNDQNVFDEARRINIALYQHAIYSQWVPGIVGKLTFLRTYEQPGPVHVEKLGFDNFYDPLVIFSGHIILI